MTMNVNLTDHLETMVKNKVASGLYNSASEVIREALRLMEAQDQVRAIKLEQLRRDIGEGLNSGEATPWDLEAFKHEAYARRAVKKTQSGV